MGRRCVSAVADEEEEVAVHCELVIRNTFLELVGANALELPAVARGDPYQASRGGGGRVRAASSPAFLGEGRAAGKADPASKGILAAVTAPAEPSARVALAVAACAKARRGGEVAAGRADVAGGADVTPAGLSEGPPAAAAAEASTHESAAGEVERGGAAREAAVFSLASCLDGGSGGNVCHYGADVGGGSLAAASLMTLHGGAVLGPAAPAVPVAEHQAFPCSSGYGLAAAPWALPPWHEQLQMQQVQQLQLQQLQLQLQQEYRQQQEYQQDRWQPANGEALPARRPAKRGSRKGRGAAPPGKDSASLLAFCSKASPSGAAAGRARHSLPVKDETSGGSSCASTECVATVSDLTSETSVGELPEDVRHGGRTTIMLRNLPNNYTRQMLLDLVDAEGFAGQYDFLYQPIDFSSKASLGYAFVNLISPDTVPRFWKVFSGFSRWSVPTQKHCRVSWSEPIQGVDANIERYRNSPVMHEGVPDIYKPVLFVNGTRVPFPPPTRKIRLPRLRKSGGCPHFEAVQ